METLRCVNPHDVNPMTTIGVVERPISVTQDQPIGARVKLEMEEFADLAPYLPNSTPRPPSNSMDELNTPVFDKRGPFDFLVHENTQYAQSVTTPTAEPFKFGCNMIGTAMVAAVPNATQSTNDFMSTAIQSAGSEAHNNNNNNNSNNLIFLMAPSDQGNNIYINNETPMEESPSANLFKQEDTISVLSANSNNENYSNVSSPIDDYNEMTTMAHMECSNSVEKQQTLKLTLALNGGEPSFIFNTLNTPDVIDEVVQLEDNFNILDYVDEQDFTTCDVKDIPLSRPSSTSTSPKTRKRKRRTFAEDDDHDEDDDEDYNPKNDSSDSESDVEKRPSASEKKRSRPSRRRTSSISSDHSDAYKYRELRDKNNEASRKSRLKRKIKEQGIEKEADELEERNVKLKAQVEQLEKVVNNFRTTLFKIMLKK